MSHLVHILGRPYALSDLMESDNGYNAVLERAKRTVGHAECVLSLRRRGRTDVEDRLARNHVLGVRPARYSSRATIMSP